MECVHCGSINHKSFDCARKPYGWTEPDAVIVPSVTLEPPRWPNGPMICPVENLPAFEDKAELAKFRNAHAGSSIKEWQCTACGMWHYKAKVPCPAGGSNGNERENTLPMGFMPFRRRRAEAAPERQADLPKREATPRPKKPVDPRPGPRIGFGRGQGSLL